MLLTVRPRWPSVILLLVIMDCFGRDSPGEMFVIQNLKFEKACIGPDNHAEETAINVNISWFPISHVNVTLKPLKRD